MVRIRCINYVYDRPSYKMEYKFYRTEYVIEDCETLKLIVVSEDEVKRHIDIIYNARIENDELMVQGCKVNEFVQKQAKKVVSGYNDLYTHCMINGYDSIIKEWSDKNNSSIHDVAKTCNQKFLWKCSVCNTEFEQPVCNRVLRGDGCPHCSCRGTSSYEQLLYRCIKEKHSDAVNRKKFGRIEFDVYIPSIKVAVEYDGGVWHGYEGTIKEYDDRLEIKEQFCKDNGITLYRIVGLLKGTDSTGIENEITRVHYYTTTNSIEVLKDCLEWLNEKIGCKTTVTREDKEAAVLASKRGQAANNSIAKSYPNVAKLWHPTLNGKLTPEKVCAGSLKRIYLVCDKCNYGANGEWDVYIKNSCKSGCGCPVCKGRTVVAGVNDLATVCPELLDEWNYEFNSIEGKTPENTSKGEKYKPYWTCKKCNYGANGEWRAALTSRVKYGTGCPRCDGKVKYIPNDIITAEELAALL